MHASHRSIVRHAVCAALLSLVTYIPAFSQTLLPVAPQATLAGPRVGPALFPDSLDDTLAKGHLTGRPHISAVVNGPFEKPASHQALPPVAAQATLAGPRFGLTLLSDGIVAKLAEREIHVRPYITQFGWQFEKQFFTRDSGATLVTEWVALVGGLEQSVVLPSVSWLVGLRTRDGAEFGIGPNITPAGTAMVFATGMTFRTGAVNVPVNVAVVPSKSGTRVTILTGFSLRRR
jgi:hypothetical protein